jgi:hypothetical protein
LAREVSDASPRPTGAGGSRASADRQEAQRRFLRDRHRACIAKQYPTPRGFEPVGNSSDAFAKFVVEDMPKGRMRVDISGVKLDK